jgi:NAD(P)-dependent dehydrogenase (short-subunit alcohol dehydrogenase family)
MMLVALRPAFGSFRGRVVAVTGASSGIGRDTAILFGRLGARVALIARRRPLLDAVAREVESAGGRALVVPADVTEPRAARAAVARIRRAWNRLDILVNNAGILLPAAVAELRAADLDAMLRVNVFGALYMMQAALPLLHARRQASIVNVASLAGRRGMSPLGGYCATKFALVGLTEALRTEVDSRRLHVGLVLPGVVDTPLVHGAAVIRAASEWPMELNMPAEWVAAAIALSVRFRLREVSVPPGAALMEEIGALVPGMTDRLIAWGRSIGRTWADMRRATATPSRRASQANARRRR